MKRSHPVGAESLIHRAIEQWVADKEKFQPIDWTQQLYNAPPI
ncbi:hypothetical protein [Acaryochloris sp. 'Moss Beach']|nr:hypothetical protein [Acaryochloris sp. 'Moss Beach']